MTYLDPSEAPQSRASSALLMGVASPLWSYFGAATAGGIAFWWMTRWTRPMNLEAMFATATPQTPLLEAVEEAAETTAVVVVEAVIEAVTEPAPTSEATMTQVTAASEPMTETVSELEAAGEPDAATEASPEPALAIAPEPVVEPEPAHVEPASNPRAKKAVASKAEPET